MNNDFEKKLVREYFKCGSINKVFHKYRFDLPISFAGYARLLGKYKVVKSAGPNSKMSESFYMLSLLANYKISLEKIYHRYAPKSIQVSINTLHRILHYTRLGLTRRQGAVLIINSKDNPNKVLIGNDNSIVSSSALGNKGDVTLPMGHTKLGEPVCDSIARILQNEVFTDEIINNLFPWSIIPQHIKPIMRINITDICVSVYSIELPLKYPKFSSFKLSNLKLTDISKINFENTRPGIQEILDVYIRPKNIKNELINSDLNNALFALAREPVE